MTPANEELVVFALENLASAAALVIERPLSVVRQNQRNAACAMAIKLAQDALSRAKNK